MVYMEIVVVVARKYGSRTRVEHLSTMLIISHACREIDEYTNNPAGWIINKVLHSAYWYTGTRSRLRIIHHRTIPRAHFRSGLIGAHADELSIFRATSGRVTECNVNVWKREVVEKIFRLISVLVLEIKKRIKICGYKESCDFFFYKNYFRNSRISYNNHVCEYEYLWEREKIWNNDGVHYQK